MQFDSEGVEEVLGSIWILFIFGIAFAVIYAGGIPVLESSKFTAHIQEVEQAFTSLDSRLSKAALGEAPLQEVRIPLAGGELKLKNDSWMNITRKNASGIVTDCINISFGSLVYESEERTVAYEAGGVWVSYPTGGEAMISPPEFHYDGETLTLPVVRLRGNDSAGGETATARVSISTDNKPELLFPATSGESACGGNVVRENPLTEGEVFVKIRSDYCNAWKNYINTAEPKVEVTEDDCETDSTITLKLITPGAPMFAYAVTATDKLIVKNTAVVDSYNSTYQTCGTVNQNGDVIARTRIEVLNSAEIKGNISADTILVCNPQSKVTGDAYRYTREPCNGQSEGQILGEEKSPPLDVGDYSPVDVSEIIEEYRNNNNNSETNCIDVQNRFKNQDCISLDSGNYYLTQFQVKNHIITFDTSSGPINIAIERTNQQSKLVLQQDTINVNGLNPVRIYLGPDITAEIGNTVFNTNGNTSLFKFIADENAGAITFKEETTLFYGTVYAPNPANEIYVQNKAAICGALIGGTVRIINSQDIHYDEALAGQEVTSGAIIQYLHISENVLDVSIS